MNIIVAKDYAGFSEKAAQVVASQLTLKKNSVLGLATGSTPLGVYAKLIQWYKQGKLDFSSVSSVNLDEYVGLPRESDQSYYYYMNENFFKHINIDVSRTNLPNGLAADVEAECKAYDTKIKALGGIDLQLLGIGHTGHIGFNEPCEEFPKGTHRVTLDHKTIEANSRFFASEKDVPKQALTMGIQSIMSAKAVLLMANGEGKAEIMYKALCGPVTPKVPASVLQLHERLYVVGDEAALSVIKEKHPELIG